MKIYKAKDYADMSRKAANIISAQIILKPECVLGYIISLLIGIKKVTLIFQQLSLLILIRIIDSVMSMI